MNIEIAKYVAGSHSHGLNTKDSDLDYRSVHISTNPGEIIDSLNQLAKVAYKKESNCTEQEQVSWELRHFLTILSRGGISSVEMLFNQKWYYITPEFQQIIDNKHSLLDPEKLNKVISGFSHSCYTTLQDGKKEFDLERFLHCLRLLYCGETFYSTGEFPTNLDGTYMQVTLKEIKKNPDKFKNKYEELFNERKKSYDRCWEAYGRNIMRVYTFDKNVANQIILSTYVPILVLNTKMGFFKKLKLLF